MYHSHRAARFVAALLSLSTLPAWAQIPAERPANVAPVSLPDATAFRVQVEAGNTGRVSAWLAAGLDANFLGDRIGSGVMIAAWEGNVPLMELFAAYGANVNMVNAIGETALMHAAWKGRMDAVRWLLAHGARLDGRGGNMQWTALHYAVFADHADIARLLIEKGADINARSPNGSSVLMMAVYENHEDMARWLVGHGADTRIKNENGDGALEWAMKFDHMKIARMVSSADEFRAAANRPKSEWGPARRSEAVPPDIEELLRIREILASRNMELDKVDRRIATLRARYARASMKKEAPPAAVLEITAERRAPERQEVRMLNGPKP